MFLVSPNNLLTLESLVKSAPGECELCIGINDNNHWYLNAFYLLHFFNASRVCNLFSKWLSWINKEKENVAKCWKGIELFHFDSFTTFLKFLIFQDKKLENMLDDFWFEDGSIKVAFPSSWKSSKINKKKNKQLKFHFQ